jgi:NhaP-type Na+/H+ or K+/H+ antiporter
MRGATFRPNAPEVHVPDSLASSPALTIAIALGAGIVCQVVARHLRVPGIVLLLGLGLALGPDGFGVIDPEILGHDLHVIVGFATAVILFEGGLALSRRRLRRQAKVIRRLLTWGVLVSAAGAVLATRLLLDWSWALALPFGTLVVVTGPTVVTPLLRRIKVNREVETTLEAEGVLVDGIGAILAVVAIEVVTLPDLDLVHGLTTLLARLGFGTAAGLVGGLVLSASLRITRLVPQDLDNPFTLTLVLVLYQACDAVMAETGIVAAIVAGMVVANSGARELRELREFKEQITVILIGMLFVLLAADVRVMEITDLGPAGVAVVLVLMLVIRPLAVAVSTAGLEMPWRQRAFLAWVAPRGIIAAAVSALFAERLEAAGIEGGLHLRALVFLVIVMTVVMQGLTAQPFARLLHLERPSNQGYAILGAHTLGRLIAGRLRQVGQSVVLMDGNPEHCDTARSEGFDVVYGNALDEREQRLARMESRRAAIGLLASNALNLRFVALARHENHVPHAMVALATGRGQVEKDALEKEDVRLLFGSRRDVDLWDLRLRRELAVLETWRRIDEEPVATTALPRETHNRLLPLLRHRGEQWLLVDEKLHFERDDEVEWLVFAEQAEDAREWLRVNGWAPPEAVV